MLLYRSAGVAIFALFLVTAGLSAQNPRLLLLAVVALLVGALAALLWRFHVWEERWFHVVSGLAFALALVAGLAVMFLQPRYSIGPGKVIQMPYQATLTLTGPPEIWTVTQTYGYGIDPETGPVDPATYQGPEGWKLGAQVGDLQPMTKTSTLDLVPAEEGEWRLTSITTFEPDRLFGDPDLLVPATGSVVTIVAPRGAIVSTHPESKTEIIPGSGMAETKLQLSMGLLDAAPGKVTIETSPAWGRDANFAFLWSLSASSIIGIVLAALWGLVGIFAKDGAVKGGKWVWRRLRPERAPAPRAVAP